MAFKEIRFENANQFEMTASENEV